MPPSTDQERPLLRFDAVERVLHWVNAGLFFVLILTAAALYVPAISSVVARRPLVERIHVVSGLILPVPVLLSVLGRWGRPLRDDLRRLNRWSAEDRRWLRLTLRREVTTGVRNGKFNAGQKLNAAFTGGSIVVMLATGVIMYWVRIWPLAWRSGATFVHEVLALAIVVVVLGHIRMALADRSAMASMFTGRVSRPWAARHAPGWLDEFAAEQASGRARAGRDGSATGEDGSVPGEDGSVPGEDGSVAGEDSPAVEVPPAATAIVDPG